MNEDNPYEVRDYLIKQKRLSQETNIYIHNIKMEINAINHNVLLSSTQKDEQLRECKNKLIQKQMEIIHALDELEAFMSIVEPNG